MRKILTAFLSVFAAFSLLFPGIASASVFRYDNINQNETLDENTYVTGGNPVIAGTIQGDLGTSGGNIYVSGNIGQDALIAGGSVNITGHIGGDLRVFCGNLVLDGPVDGELLAYCGTVFIGPHAVIRGDVNVQAGRVQIDPSAKLLNSRINISSAAHDQAVAPRPDYVDTNQFLTAAFWVTQIMLLIGLLVVVGVLHLLFPNFTKRFLQKTTIQKNMFWKNFLIGLVLLIVMPVAAILAFCTIVGGFIGALILIAYGAFIIAGMIYGSVVFGGLLYELIKKPKKYQFNWWWIILGIIGLHLLGMLPIVGWMISFVFFLVAFGAMATVRFGELRSS